MCGVEWQGPGLRATERAGWRRVGGGRVVREREVKGLVFAFVVAPEAGFESPDPAGGLVPAALAGAGSGAGASSGTIFATAFSISWSWASTGFAASFFPSPP